ncbi:ribosome biogenesis GTPase Der [bacterium]|nr:ribosome biogenesis GTPase Der [bacterium]
MSSPIIAIVGRPNVGKSTLFNRLIRRRKAIVDDEPGVTRDRNYGTCDWDGRRFILIDTGGLDIGTDVSIHMQVHNQALIAIEEADLIIFLMDGKDGLLPEDKEIYLALKRSKKPVVCVINKVDNNRIASSLSDFYSIGEDSFFPISASHGTGIDDMMGRVMDALPARGTTEDKTEITRLAIIGRTNVGKSSLLNSILRKERSLVSEEPGTTRDCIDTPFNYNHRSYLIIDTAGIRRRKKVKAMLERITIIKTIKSIENCHVALFLIDAVDGITEQDVRIAGFAHEAGKAVIVVVNKWDAVAKDDKAMKRHEEEFRFRLKYLSYAPMIFVSAITGQRIYKIFPLVERVMEQYRMRVTTGKLNRIINASIEHFPPPLHKGRKIKIYYQTQVAVQPPTFAFFVNIPDGIHFSYRRYLQNQIREKLGLDSTPLRLVFRHKGE